MWTDLAPQVPARHAHRMQRPAPLPEALRTGPFSTETAHALGVSPKRLRAGDLESPFRGVRVQSADPAAEPDDLHSMLVATCRAYSLHAGPDEWFSHATAARLWRLPVPWRLTIRTELDVSVYPPSHPPQIAGVIGHRISRAVRGEWLGGLPVVPALEAWVQLAAQLTVDELIAFGDGLVRRKSPLASMDEIGGVVAASARRPGVRRLREAIPLVRPGTDSAPETETRLILVRAGLPEPAIGHTVFDHGYFVGTPDLAYPVERVALDYEGDVHRLDGETFRGDIERREMFQDVGWRHIRITKDHLRRPHRLVDRVRYALAQRR